MARTNFLLVHWILEYYMCKTDGKWDPEHKVQMLNTWKLKLLRGTDLTQACIVEYIIAAIAVFSYT